MRCSSQPNREFARSLTRIFIWRQSFRVGVRADGLRRQEARAQVDRPGERVLGFRGGLRGGGGAGAADLSACDGFLKGAVADGS